MGYTQNLENLQHVQNLQFLKYRFYKLKLQSAPNREKVIIS